MLADIAWGIHGGVLAVGALLLVGAGLHDVAARTVPNRLSAAIAALGLAARLLEGTSAYGVLFALAVAIAVFAVATICWHRGWMGGGDVKLLAAAALLVPPASVPALVVYVALAGGILAVVYLLLYATLPERVISAPRPRSVPARALRVERWRIARKGPIPYASAIAVGALFCLLGE